MSIDMWKAGVAIASTVVVALVGACESSASLSARSAFTLIGRVAPGDALTDAVEFLGSHASERESGGAFVWTWGTGDDEWTFDVLHDGATVRATRVVWQEDDRRTRLSLFGQITSEGRRNFERAARFPRSDVAEWRELDGHLLVRAEIDDARRTVSLLTGVRGGKYATDANGF